MVSGNLAHLSNKQAVRSDSGRYAVIDVGSNSIRLVIFDRLTRGLSIMFNEKVLCGLGSNINVTGRLNEEGIHQAEALLSSLLDYEANSHLDVDE